MKYTLPIGVSLKEPVPEKYTQETLLVFIDEKYGEWITNFKSFIKSKGLSTHPKAVAQRRASTNKTLYGGNAPANNKYVLNKMKKTILERYGVDNASKSEEIKNKKKVTLLKNHGVENPMHSDEIKEKQKRTIHTKYNVDNVMQHEEIQKKHRKIQLDKGYAKSLPNGKTISEYYQELEKLHKSNAHVVYNNLGPDIAQKWIEEYKDKGPSSLEIFTKENIDCLETYQKGIGVYRPDFIVKGKTDIFVDVDGLHWHNENIKDKQFHFNKREYYQNTNKTILQFYQDEIINKTAIVESIINAKAGLIKTKIRASKCSLSYVSSIEATQFLNENHLMGGAAYAKNIGLYKDNVLVSLLTYKKKRKGIEIVRFCNKIKTIVHGSLSRLIKWLKKEYNPQFIESFVDMRYGNGNSLKILGFRLESCSISFKWTDGYNTFHRLKCRANMDKRKLSEKEQSDELGWRKIYDAGQAKWIFKCTSKDE